MTVVAALDREDSQASTAVKSMLSTVRAPGCRYYLGWRGHADSSRSVDDLAEPGSPLALGVAAESGAPTSRLLSQDGWCAALEGYLLHGRDPTESMGKGPHRLMEALIELEGAFSCITATRLLVAYRDPLGRVPLYVADSGRWLLLATRKRCIWGNSPRDPELLPPGRIVRYAKGRMSVSRPSVRWPQHPRPVSPRDAARKVAALLLDAVGRWSAGLDASALAFSGGLDSGLLAYLAKELVALRLITVDFAQSGEYLGQAERAASILALPIRLMTPSKSETEERLRDVVWGCESADRISVETALPIFCVSREARQMAYTSILTGHGADELFGGYMRYLRSMKRDPSMTFQRMRLDFLNLQRRDLETDFKACASNSLSLRLPYTDVQLARYVLSLPPSLRVDVNSGVRKLVLRDAARLLGCPRQIADAEKKAVQYSTGASKMLRIIAREQNRTVGSFLSGLLDAAKRSAKEQGLL